MKNRNRLLLAALLTLAALSLDAAPAAKSPPYYGELLDHGVWFTLSGDWVWQPRVVQSDRNWRPYFTAGNWRRENKAWFWASDYVWGAIVFHHGRWFASPANGWVWVPGSDWSAAWVQWRIADDLCGWAPQPPGDDFFARIGVRGYKSTEAHFTFVPARRFLERDLDNHAADGSWYWQRSRAVVHGPAPAMVGLVESFGVTDTYGNSSVILGAPVAVYPDSYIYYPRTYVYPAPDRLYHPYRHERRPVRHERHVRRPEPPKRGPARQPASQPRAPVRTHPAPAPRLGPIRTPSPAPSPRLAPGAPLRAPFRAPPAGAAGKRR